MARMTFAPIQYALAIVRFPPILNMAEHVGAFQDRIRQDYELADDIPSQGITAQLGPQGFRIEPSAGRLWQFADAQREHAVMLAPDFVLLHAGQAYEGHERFLDRFNSVLTAVAETPGLRVTHVVAMGMRVVDLVVPRPRQKEVLDDYLQGWALPPFGPALTGEEMQAQASIYISTFTTAHGLLRFQVLRRPGGAFPPDLDNPFVRMNGWVGEVPKGDYVILDTDHSTALRQLVEFEPSRLRQKFAGIHSSVRQVFDAAVTPRAVKIWSRKK